MTDREAQRAKPTEVRKAMPLEAIQAAIESIQFGVVQLIIQDGHVVQIDKTEKVRLR